MKRILLACPVYDGMAYCFKQFIENLRQVDYSDFKIVVFDNSRTKGFFRKIKKNPFIKVIHDDTKEEKNMDRVISSRNKILDYAIEKNFDYLLMLDSDVMVKPDILKKLLSFDKEVISGIYYNYFRIGGKKLYLPVAFASISQEEFDTLKQRGELPKHAKTKEDIMRHLNPEEMKKEIVDVKIPSPGCTLLSRKAFTSGARYNLLENFPNEVFVTEDMVFFNTLRKEGFKIYSTPTVICDHLTAEKYKHTQGAHPMSL